MNTYIDFIKIFLFLLLLSFSNELTDKYNRGTYNVICATKNKGCTFNITSNYPISPKIPTFILENAIIGSYWYIYLLFTPQQKPQTFYLEAYDTSNGETIISNGDCYLIDISDDSDYEIRIDKELKSNGFVQLRFFGLPQNFTMQVRLQFELSGALYIRDKVLDKDNSLYKNDLAPKYIEEYNKKLVNQNERQIMCKEIIKKIRNNFFGTKLDIKQSILLGYDFINSISIPLLPFLITISYSVGLEISPEKIFKPERNILSETKVTNGKITFITNGIDSSGYKKNLDKAFSKIMESYNNRIIDLILGFGIDNENFSLTVSSSSYSVIILTFTFYSENTNTIKYEIEIKIDITMKAVLEKVLVLAESFGGDPTPVVESIGKGPGLYIIFLIISHVLSPGLSFNTEALSAFLLSIFPYAKDVFQYDSTY